MHRRHGNQVKVNGRCFAAAVGGVRLHRTLTRHPWKGHGRELPVHSRQHVMKKDVRQFPVTSREHLLTSVNRLKAKELRCRT